MTNGAYLMKYLYCDFEFNSPSDVDMGLVSVAMSDGTTTNSIWLVEDQGKIKAKKLIEGYRNHIIVCFNADAEARCFTALGVNPRKYQWIDLYADFRQLRNNDVRYKYGRFVKYKKSIFSGKQEPVEIGQSIAPPFKAKTGYVSKQNAARTKAIFMNKHKEKTGDEVSTSLINATAIFTDISDADLLAEAKFKVKMRDVILGKPNRDYTPEEKAEILEYGEADIADLKTIMDAMGKALVEASHDTPEDVQQYRLDRGSVCVDMACVASHGTPVSLDRLNRLVDNGPNLINIAKAHVNMEHNLPTYQWSHVGRRANRFRFNAFSFKQAVFGKWVDSQGLSKAWPRNNSNTGYKVDSETLDLFEEYKYINDIWRVNSLTSAVKFAKVDPTTGKAPMFEAIGKDGNLRCSLGAFGTQSARNAPRARQYLYAQGAWMKSMIEIPEGYKLVESDFSSQEYFVGAVLGDDNRMRKAYESDVYISFGVAANLYPASCDNLTIAEIKKSKESEVQDIRNNILKGIVLGLGYGMGDIKLALATKLDLPFVSKLTAKYKSRYRKYYAWRDKVWAKHCKARRPITVRYNGWYLGRDNDRPLSTQNFPVQTTASAILHRTLKLCLDAEVPVCNVLHDAVYYIIPEDDHTTQPLVEKLMLQASADVLGEEGMKVESEEWHHGERVITKKGREDYVRYGKHIEQSEDIFKEICKNQKLKIGD